MYYFYTGLEFPLQYQLNYSNIVKEFIKDKEKESNEFQLFIQKAHIIFENSKRPKNSSIKKKNQNHSNLMTFYTADKRFTPITKIDDNCEIYGYKNLLRTQYKNSFFKYDVPKMDFSRDERYFLLIIIKYNTKW